MGNTVGKSRHSSLGSQSTGYTAARQEQATSTLPSIQLCQNHPMEAEGRFKGAAEPMTNGAAIVTGRGQKKTYSV